MPVPIVCPGKYANVTASFLGEPTPPGNDDEYPVFSPTAFPTVQNSYFAFTECEFTTSAKHTVVMGGWSNTQGVYGGGQMNGQARLAGFVPAQVALGLHVGRRLALTHSWAWTDPQTSTAYSKTGTVPVKIVKVVVGTRVNDVIRVNIEAEMDYRRMQPQYGADYIWDNQRQPGSYGYRSITPDPKSSFPFQV